MVYNGILIETIGISVMVSIRLLLSFLAGQMFNFLFFTRIYTILPKVLGRPLLMNRFDYFSNFYEYKS